MSQNDTLTDEERAELEQLRAEKAAREQAARAAAERAELDRLRAEKAQAQKSAEVAAARSAQQAQEAADLERARKLMEPDDDDLKMAPGQKIVIAAVVGIALVWLLITIFG